MKIVIPSTNDYCISNLVLIRAKNRFDNNCTQVAAALPKIELEVFMFKPISEHYFFLTAGSIRADTVGELNEKFNQYIIHEATHRVFYDFGIEPRKHPDEKFVDYIENAVVYHASAEKQHGPPAPGPAAFGFALTPPSSADQGMKIAVEFNSID